VLKFAFIFRIYYVFFISIPIFRSTINLLFRKNKIFKTWGRCYWSLEWIKFASVSPTQISMRRCRLISASYVGSFLNKICCRTDIFKYSKPLYFIFYLAVVHFFYFQVVNPTSVTWRQFLNWILMLFASYTYNNGECFYFWFIWIKGIILPFSFLIFFR
jgi:hypothetical protein